MRTKLGVIVCAAALAFAVSGADRPQLSPSRSVVVESSCPPPLSCPNGLAFEKPHPIEPERR